MSGLSTTEDAGAATLIEAFVANNGRRRSIDGREGRRSFSRAGPFSKAFNGLVAGAKRAIGRGHGPVSASVGSGGPAPVCPLSGPDGGRPPVRCPERSEGGRGITTVIKAVGHDGESATLGGVSARVGPANPIEEGARGSPVKVTRQV